MFEYDYEFCERKDCPRRNCRRHLSHVPVGVPFSMCRLYDGAEFEECEWYMAGPEVYDVKLNMNTATEEELMGLGLSETRAALIVKFRESRGPYRSVRDLLKLHGFGKVTYGKICGRLYVEEAERK